MVSRRELWQATMRCQPVERLLFWPKLGSTYPARQSTPFCEMNLVELYKWLGSDTHFVIPGCTREMHSKCASQVQQADGIRQVTYVTPVGNLVAEDRFEPGSGSMHPTRFPVTSPAELKILIEWFADIHVELHPPAFEQARAQHAAVYAAATTMSSMGTTPLMDFVQRYAGIDTAQYLLMDYPDEVRELFALMTKVLYRKCEIAAEHNPADMLHLTENTSTTLISPRQFQEFCYPHIAAIGKMLADAGRYPVLHMCGHIKALLPVLAQTPIRAYEAFTSPTVGNTTLLDGRSACPDVCLIGGTNAALWTQSAAAIIATLEKDLAELPHHRGLVISPAGVMPPCCPPETIKQVCAWVQNYPVIN